MTLRFKVGTYPAQMLYVCRKKKTPVVGEIFFVVDKNVSGSKPYRVRLSEIRQHTGAGDIYFVERF
jgi:hypothetical protein